jgi:type 1 glutamine amidotransferase
MRTSAQMLTVGAAAALLIGCVSGPAASKGADESRVLVFSKTAGFRHDSIPEGIAAVRELGTAGGFAVDATEDAGAFTPKNLARYDAVVFLSTTGDVLDDTQQTAFERYIKRGGGYVGIHAAADTEYDWAFYGGLAGAYFQSHPAIRAHVLASLDESSYTGGTMSGDHPIAWCQEYRGGRAFYTGGGHTKESYAEPAFRKHLLGGIRYAIGDAQADCRPENGYRPLFDGTAESLAAWKQAGPGSFSLSDDGTLTSNGGLGMLWYAGSGSGSAADSGSAAGFGSYSLKLDWKVAGDDNSGVFVGFPASDDPWSAVNNGYEIQIDATDTPDRTTGAVYSFQSADIDKRDRALNPPGEWNTYEIRVEGERLRVWLNGVKINDFTNTDPARSLREGHVGIQNHGADDQVSFRDVRIKELPSKPMAYRASPGD